MIPYRCRISVTPLVRPGHAGRTGNNDQSVTSPWYRPGNPHPLLIPQHRRIDCRIEQRDDGYFVHAGRQLGNEQTSSNEGAGDERTGFDQPPDGSPLHVDDAADAARRALTRGSAGIYNIAEEDGTVSIRKAAQALGWESGFRIRES